DIFSKLRLDQHDDRRGRLDPALGLVGAGTWHVPSVRAGIAGRHGREKNTGNRGFRPPIWGAIGRGPEALLLQSAHFSKGSIRNGEDQGGKSRRRNGRRRDDAHYLATD